MGEIIFLWGGGDFKVKFAKKKVGSTLLVLIVGSQDLRQWGLLY